MRFIAFLCALGLSVWSYPAVCEPKSSYNQVNFSVALEQSVANDVLVAVLTAEAEGREAKSLAVEVNENMAWALKKVQAEHKVEAQTLDYRTNPRYQKGEIVAWQVEQSIRLESQDSDQLSELIGQLQSRLKVRSLNYQVSPGKRDQVEQILTKQALKQFTQRANEITQALNFSQYRLVEITIDTDNVAQPRPQLRAVQMLRAEAVASAPVIQAGTQKLKLWARGTIELER